MGFEHENVGRASWSRRSLTVLVAALAAVAGVGAVRSHAAPGRVQAPVKVPEAAWASALASSASPATSAPSTQVSRGKIPGGALSAVATLGQAKLLAGSDGELLLHVGVDAVDDPSTRAHRPIDFALVLDTSGSMEEESKITLLKRATEDLLAKLGPDDRVALVSFANDARTVFPLAVLGDEARRKAYSDAVDALEPSGGTNISEGLLAGAEELRRAEPRPGSARRIVLMTDGLANFGVQEPAELARLVSGLAREGFTLSTIGLGADYSGKVLSDMADAGGGAFYDAAKADRLAGIYDAEVRATRSLVARDTRLKIVPAAGVTVESVYFWPASEGKSGESLVALGDLSAGRHLKVVARLRVPTTGKVTSLPVVSVSLRYDDVRGKAVEAVASESVSLGVELAASQEVARASTATEIKGNVNRVAVACGLQCAQDLARAGRNREALAALAVVKKHNGGESVVTWDNADGTVGKLNVRETFAAVFREGDKERDGNLDYGSLSELGNTTLVDSTIGKGSKAGYSFQAGSSDSTSEFLWFALANPQVATTSGDRYFTTNAAGVIFYTTNPDLVLDTSTCSLPMSGLNNLGK